jgi:hypothetical protein
MRTEHSTDHGFDHDDPRLALRRAAAESQREPAVAEPVEPADHSADDPEVDWWSGLRVRVPVGAGELR